MNSISINELREKYAVERDAKEFSIGDTLDVKTSVVLVVIVFLAEQSDHFFQATLTCSQWLVQLLSVGCLILAGIFAILELRPREYQTEGTPSEYDEWLEQLRKHYAESLSTDEDVLEEAIKGRTLRAQQRAELNIVANGRKSVLLQTAFWFTTVSFALNLATLIIRLF